MIAYNFTRAVSLVAHLGASGLKQSFGGFQSTNNYSQLGLLPSAGQLSISSWLWDLLIIAENNTCTAPSLACPWNHQRCIHEKHLVLFLNRRHGLLRPHATVPTNQKRHCWLYYRCSWTQECLKNTTGHQMAAIPLSVCRNKKQTVKTT